MANQETSANKLADIIKSTHSYLREEVRKGESPEVVWERHCGNRPHLEQYAATMHALATQHWQLNNQKEKENNDNGCRISWTYKAMGDYFWRGGQQKAESKEMRKLAFDNCSSEEQNNNCKSHNDDAIVSETIQVQTKDEQFSRIASKSHEGTKHDNETTSSIDSAEQHRTTPDLISPNTALPASPSDPVTAPVMVSVLDCGSCYNPFGRLPGLCVTAIDLQPATGDVLECDFLNVNIDLAEEPQANNIDKHDISLDTDNCSLEIDKCSAEHGKIYLEKDHNCHDKNEKEETKVNQKILNLPAASFDACVFCLLLEYLPSPEQRLQCCRNAYNVLRPSGILIIVTPDSKHVNSNVFLYKCWQVSLARLGFVRVKYDKREHFHGMVFRKALHRHLCQAESQKMLLDLKSKQLSMCNKIRDRDNGNKMKLQKVGKFSRINLDEIHKGLLIPQDLQYLDEKLSTNVVMDEHLDPKLISTKRKNNSDDGSLKSEEVAVEKGHKCLKIS